jgi:hypothetical protein
MKDKWQIRETARDWECDWKSTERFHLRYFRSLSMKDKVQAVEEMCRVADLLMKNRVKKRKPARARLRVPARRS